MLYGHHSFGCIIQKNKTKYYFEFENVNNTEGTYFFPHKLTLNEIVCTIEIKPGIIH